MSKWTATDLFTVYDTLIALWQLHKVISLYGLSKVVNNTSSSPNWTLVCI